ncbi:hypothetical protein Q0O81_14335, partial [Staphylococcus aureus]|nr:hypothetical protein [Staphylococcus aureus]
HFHKAYNDQIMAYSKVDAISGNAILVVVNLDPFATQEGMVHIDAEAIGLAPGESFEVDDLVSGERYTWSTDNFVRLT